MCELLPDLCSVTTSHATISLASRFWQFGPETENWAAAAGWAVAAAAL